MLLPRSESSEVVGGTRGEWCAEVEGGGAGAVDLVKETDLLKPEKEEARLMDGRWNPPGWDGVGEVGGGGPSIEARGEEGRGVVMAASGAAVAGVEEASSVEGGGGEVVGVDGWDLEAAAAFLRRSAKETIQEEGGERRSAGR